MRLIAVPLARIRPGAPPVTTFLAQSNKAIARASAPAKANNTTPGATTNTTTTDTDAPNANTIDKGKSPEKNAIEGEKEDKPPLTTRLMNKASDFWIGLGREGQKSTFDWKRKTYNAGEKLMDRIEYEEWALKGVDPTLGPTLNLQEVAKKRAEAKQSQAASQNVKDITKIGLSPVAALNVPLLFPSSLLSANGLLSSLTRLTASRQPHHRQRLIWCIVGMPLTIPFILIPVVPNLPFFYLLWRAWSHWRAYQSSKYLSELIKQGRLVPTPSKDLDQIIASDATTPLPPRPKQTKTPDHKETASLTEPDTSKIDYNQYLLLNTDKIKNLVKTFNLDHQLSIELTRARQQTIKSIERGQMDKLEEAAAGTSTKESDT